jgi:spore maturation protein CgeB
MHLLFNDFEQLCVRGNVFFFVGNDCTAQLADFLASAPMKPLPDFSVHVEQDRLSELVDSIEQRRLQRIQPYFELIDTYYGALTVEKISSRFNRCDAEPLRIVCVTSLFTTVLQYSTRDVARAFEKLGCEVKVVKERSACDRMVLSEVMRVLSEFKPDMLFTINHLRAEYKEALPRNMLFVSWVQDEMAHLFEPGLAKKTTDADFIYAVAPSTVERCEKTGYKNVKLLCMATNPDIYFAPQEKNPKYECDIALITNVSMPETLQQYPELVPHIVRLIREEDLVVFPIENAKAVLARAEKDLSMRVDEKIRADVLWYILNRIARYARRTEVALWAKQAGYRLKLYGDGWETIPELQEFACGRVASGDELRDLYFSARLHLHINEGINMHQRVFECISSGGFILVRSLPSDNQPGGLGEFMEIGKELITFSVRADFLERVTLYLNNEQERQKVIEAGRRRVLNEHTYECRMRKVLQDIRERLNACVRGEIGV